MRVSKQSRRVVIADDDSTTRHALRLLLHEHGLQVVAEASDGEKAVELCEVHRPDIAFLDINMPRLDGHQAAERIRQRVPNTGMIMISAVPTLDNVQKALQLGVSRFVVKPFNAVKVVEAVEDCLQQKN
ncbi:MAG TPA: response regulator [Noviherbaspirillum sp.]